MLFEHAPAKINLALHLRRRRDDGYHDLESLFAFTAFGDTLAAEPADGLHLAITGPMAVADDAGLTGGDNLVLRAACALAAAAGVAANARLRLEKHIPVAAGLGGGSADAAAALRLLNRLWGLGWPTARLLPLAAALGAGAGAGGMIWRPGRRIWPARRCCWSIRAWRWPPGQCLPAGIASIMAASAPACRWLPCATT